MQINEKIRVNLPLFLHSNMIKTNMQFEQFCCDASYNMQIIKKIIDKYVVLFIWKCSDTLTDGIHEFT